MAKAGDSEREAIVARYQGLPSVTTICNIIDKPGLLGWYASSTARKAADELTELVRKIEADGYADAVAWLSDAPRDLRDGAAGRGRTVHGILESVAKGEPLPAEMPDGVRPLVEAGLKFIADEGLVIEHAEQSVINERVGYAGTYDWRGACFSSLGVPVVGDWKTGRSGPHRTWGLQLSAYVFAPSVWTPDGVVDAPAVSKERAVIVKLLSSGNYRAYWLDGQDGRVALPDLFNVFRAARHLYAFEHGGGKLWA